MAYGEIIVPISGGNEDGSILGRAKALFAKYKIPTTLLYIEPDPNDMMYWPADGTVSVMGATLVETIKQTSAELWDKIVAEAAQLPEFSLERVIGPCEILLEERANLADLMVISDVCAQGKTSMSPAFEQALMHGRIPALILHEDDDFSLDNVTIAWDGSPQAARAVKAAMPFIEKAKSVNIVQISEVKETQGTIIREPNLLAAKLEKFGVKPTIVMKECIDKNIGASIVDCVMEMKSDLLVAGAYGHSRAREFVFGGATKSFLKSSGGPHLLISH